MPADSISPKSPTTPLVIGIHRSNSHPISLQPGRLRVASEGCSPFARSEDRMVTRPVMSEVASAASMTEPSALRPVPEEPAAQATKPREDGIFGLQIAPPTRDCAEYRQFLKYEEYARKLEWTAMRSKRYERKETSYVNEDGTTITDHYYARTKKTWTERRQEIDGKNGQRVKKAYNHATGCVRKIVGRPRKTGSNYGSRKGTGALLNPSTLMPAEQAAIGITKTRTGMAGDPDPSDGVGTGSDVLGNAALPLAVIEGMDAANDLMALCSARARAKADMLRYRKEAYRFIDRFDSATPQQAEAYRRFVDAGKKLLGPTEEEKAINAVTQDVAVRNLVFQPASAGLFLGAQVARHAGNSVPVEVGFGTAPVSLAAAIVDLHQASKERQRRAEQKKMAQDRKQKLQSALGEDLQPESAEAAPGAAADQGQGLAGGPDKAGFRAGVLSSLKLHQDRLIRQAEREEKFAFFRSIKAGGNIGASTAQIAMLIALAGGAVTTASAGVATPAAAVPLLVGATAAAVRNGYRHQAETTRKERERWAQDVCLRIPRETLEEMLARPADEDATLTVELGEGEYLPGEDRFAGKRTLSFDVRKNEYVGLHMFALQIQDLICQRKAPGEVAPWIEALLKLGVAPGKLFSLLIEARAKPADVQLDFIQSQLAPVLGMKFSMAGEKQVRPHPSLFLDDFDAAWEHAVGSGEEVLGSPGLCHRAADLLAGMFPDEAQGRKIFMDVARDFVDRTAKLPSSPRRDRLQMVLAAEALAQATTETITAQDILERLQERVSQTGIALSELSLQEFYQRIQEALRDCGVHDQQQTGPYILFIEAYVSLLARSSQLESDKKLKERLHALTGALAYLQDS